MKELTRRAGQAVYGDLTIGTGSGGLRWSGTLQRSFLSGEAVVRNANLTFPPTRELILRTDRNVTFTVVDDRAGMASTDVASETVDPDALERALFAELFGDPPAMVSTLQTMNGTAETSFLDNIVYDLVVEAQALTYVRFVFNPLTGEELFADLRGRMLFTKDGDRTRLAGEVEVGDRSYYSFFKKFQASGKLVFTGDPLNPELQIVARYEGIVQGRDTVQAATAPERAQEQKVAVILHITGTRTEPKVAMQLERFNAATGRLEAVETGDVESDAIYFLLTGSFREELTQQERTTVLGTNLLYSLTSSVLSGPITELVRKELGFISSVDVIYYGGSLQTSTDVRVTGEVGEAVIRLGGRVFSDINNTNWSIQVPMSAILGSPSWRNLMIEAERRVEGVENFELRRESNNLRLLYRISF
jgi:hypothetical protein